MKYKIERINGMCFYSKRSLRLYRRRLSRSLVNTFGWRTNKKYIILESDDWGGIRVPSKKTYDYLLKSGDIISHNPFTKYDSLASEADLSFLFEVLSKHRDYKGKNPVITANCVVANPDFKKIEASKFCSYNYELFTETLKSYPRHENSFEIWKQGMDEKVFFPQFHCREHINIARWLKSLMEKKNDAIIAFNNKMIGIGNSFSPDNKYGYMDACNYETGSESNAINEIMKQGAMLFRNIFGYDSKSFIAPCNIWGGELEYELSRSGIQYIQGNIVQKIPKQNKGTKHFGKKYHYCGQLNGNNQIYLIRNCDFEPAMNESIDWVDSCLLDISEAFKKGKPATICTHRLNYIGFIHEGNRDRNLRMLSNLLHKIMAAWPDVEFITTIELGEKIMDEYLENCKGGHASEDKEIYI